MCADETDQPKSMLDGSEPVTPAGSQSREEVVRAALRMVEDPEMGIDVVRLGLIRDIRVDGEDVRIVMVLTSPFCPYGGMLVQQVVDAARPFTAGEVRVEMGHEMWTPAMMEDADLAEWGLL